MLFAVGSARGQSARLPFSTVMLYAGGTAQVGANRFGDFYRPAPGLDLVASTPFYAGVAGLDAGLRHYEARPGRASGGFWAVPAALRWGLRLPLGARLRAEGAARLGGLFMRFGDGGPGLRDESELLMGGDVGLSFRLSRRWQLVAGARYEHVFTAPALQLWHVRAGVRHRFDAPHWFQSFLR